MLASFEQTRRDRIEPISTKPTVKHVCCGKGLRSNGFPYSSEFLCPLGVLMGPISVSNLGEYPPARLAYLSRQVKINQYPVRRRQAASNSASSPARLQTLEIAPTVSGTPRKHPVIGNEGLINIGNEG